MKLKEYLEKIKVLQNEIEGCKNLIDFYVVKKERLEQEYQELLNSEVGK